MPVTALESNALRLSFAFPGFLKKISKKDEDLVFLCHCDKIIRPQCQGRKTGGVHGRGAEGAEEESRMKRD